MASQELYNLIRSLNEEGVAIVMVSHDIGAALHDANRVLCMHKTVSFVGTVEEYMKSDCGRFLWGCREEGCCHDR